MAGSSKGQWIPPVISVGFVVLLWLFHQGRDHQPDIAGAKRNPAAVSESSGGTPPTLDSSESPLKRSAREKSEPAHDRGDDQVAFDGVGVVFPPATAFTIGHIPSPRWETLKCHQDVVLCADFSPDGKTMATASADTTVGLWNVETGQELGRLRHSKPVFAVAFSPDGKMLATGTGTFEEQGIGALTLWDVETQKPLRDLRGHMGSICSLTFSKQESKMPVYLLSGSTDRTLIAWDPATGQELRAFGGHGGPVDRIVVSPGCPQMRDGDRSAMIASGSMAGETLIWAKGQRYLDVTNAIPVAFSPRDDLLAVASKSLMGMMDVAGDPLKSYEILLVDLATNQTRQRLKEHAAHVVTGCFTADGRRLITLDEIGYVLGWDIASGKTIFAVTAKPARPSTARFSRDRRFLVAASSLKQDAGIVYLTNLPRNRDDSGEASEALKSEGVPPESRNTLPKASEQCPADERDSPLQQEQLAEARKAEQYFIDGIRLAKEGVRDQAIANFRIALDIFEELADADLQQAQCQMNIGELLRELGQIEDAISEHERALENYRRSSGTDQEIAQCLVRLGLLYEKAGKYDKAAVVFRDARTFYSYRPGTDCEQAECLLRLGAVLHALSFGRDAAATIREALAQYRRVPGADQRQADCLRILAAPLTAIGRLEEAITAVKEALALYQRLPDTEGEQGDCYVNLGAALVGMGRPEDALSCVQQATATYGRTQDQTSYAAVLVLLGESLRYLDRYEESIATEREAIAILRGQPGTEYEQSGCHRNIGLALRELGHHDEALTELRHALALVTSIPSRAWDQKCCFAIVGSILNRSGRFREAVQELSVFAGDSGGWLIDEEMARALEGIGSEKELVRALRHHRDAIQQVEAERMLLQSTEDRISWFEERAEIYENTAALVVRMKRERIAVESLDAQLWGRTPEEIALHFADRGKGATLLELISTRVLQTGDERSSELLAEQRQLDDEVNILLKHRGVEAEPDMESEFHELTRQIEHKQARQREIDAELRRTAAGAFIEPEFLKPADFCKSLQPEEACLEYVACEHELLIFLVTAQGVKAYRVEITRDTPREYHENGRPILEKLVAAYRQAPEKPEALGLEGLVWLQREWMDQFRQRKLTEAEHVAISWALRQVLFPKALSETLVDGHIKHLVIVPSRVLALTSFATLVTVAKQAEHVPTELSDCRFLMERFSLSYVQSLSLLEPIRHRGAEQGRAESASREFLALADAVHDERDPRAGTDIRGLQLTEVETERAGSDMVTRTLVRGVTIATDAQLENSSLTWPRLEETRREAERAGREFGDVQVYQEPVLELPAESAGNVVCVGHAANRLLAKSAPIGEYRHLLFGVHGYTDMTNPWLSSLMLTDLAAEPGKRQPAPLTMADVFGMKLRAQTVVLAACHTALGRMRAGEGVVGFQLAFLFAGAETVMLTQWEVPSAVPTGSDALPAYPTTEVITGFYGGIRKGNATRAEALRQAQLQVRAEGKELADPFYWGAWQLFGEWR